MRHFREIFVFVACVASACGGDDGEAGATGAKGEKGDPGAPGAVGERGATGASGEAGAPGVVKVLSFQADSVLATLASAVPTVPDKCKTAAYTAGAGERAVITVDGSLFPNALVNAIVYVGVAVFKNGAPFEAIGDDKNRYSFEGLNDGVASSSITVTYPLVAGTSYVFGTIFESGSASTFAITKSTCHGTALIVRD